MRRFTPSKVLGSSTLCPVKLDDVKKFIILQIDSVRKFIILQIVRRPTDDPNFKNTMMEKENTD